MMGMTMEGQSSSVAVNDLSQTRATQVGPDLNWLTFHGFYSTVASGPASFINKWLWQDTVDAAIGFTASWGRPFPNWQHASVPALDLASSGRGPA